MILGIVEVTTSHATPDHRAFQANIYGVLALFASLISNIWATSLVGYKAWCVTMVAESLNTFNTPYIFVRCHRRDIQAYLGNAGTTSAVHSVLVLLVESGFLYCIIWVSEIHERPVNVLIPSTTWTCDTGHIHPWYRVSALHKPIFTHVVHTISSVVLQLVVRGVRP